MADQRVWIEFEGRRFVLATRRDVCWSSDLVCNTGETLGEVMSGEICDPEKMVFSYELPPTYGLDPELSLRGEINTAEEVVQSAARILSRAALDTFVVDQHRWSSRPCQTCRQISTLLGEPWGCYEYQRRKR